MTVSVLCLADRPERLPVLVWSLLAQTHTAWELLILDQSGGLDVDRYCGPWMEVAVRRGHRVEVQQVERLNDWGQTVKERGALGWATGDVLMFPNDDAYYVPIALERFVAAIAAGSDLAVSGWLYDLLGYVAMPPNTQVGHIDVGGFAVRRDTFLATGWPCKAQTGDGELVQGFLRAGARVGLVPNTLYVKN
jgi:hypothetical protein